MGAFIQPFIEHLLRTKHCLGTRDTKLIKNSKEKSGDKSLSLISKTSFRLLSRARARVGEGRHSPRSHDLKGAKKLCNQVNNLLNIFISQN